MADMYRNGRGRRGRGAALSLCVFLSLVLGSVLFLEVKISPLLEMVAKEQAQVAVVKIIQETIAGEITPELRYEDVMNIYREDNGKIALMAPNYGTINSISSNIFIKVDDAMAQLQAEAIAVPLGAALGSRLFAAAGPDIPISVLPMGKIDVNLTDEFIQAGINQVKHLVSVEVTVGVKVAVPFYREEMTVTAGAPICESIIIGEIPGTYFHMNESQSGVGQGLLPGVWGGKALGE